MFSITCVSVRCATDGNGNVIEDSVKGSFKSTEDAQKHIRREFADVSSYWRTYILDANGRKIVRGTRTGRGGTGKRWVFEDVPAEN